MACCVFLAALASPASAQFGDLLNRAQQKANQAVDKTVDSATKPPQSKPAPSTPAQAPTSSGAAQSGAAKSGTAPAAGDDAAPAAASAEAYGNRYDFVPGDKVLVFDDFSDTDVGEYPAKWTIKDGGGNAIEVVQVGDRRFLKTRFQKERQDSAFTWLRYTIKDDMPKNFTIEFDMDVAGNLGVMFSAKYGFGGQELAFRSKEDYVRSANANGKMPVKQGIHHVAIAVSGTQLKVYVAGERVLTDPDGVVRPIKRIGIHFGQPYIQGEGDHQMFTSLRIAEGGKPAKQMLAGEGRIVTHGILFDTGSDVIKPESGPTLRSILALLNEDPGLKFSVEGHTDDQGGPKVNGPLSEKRAAAVKAWLVKEGVDAARLTSKGLGQTKPIDTNDTAEGRANNRRVEFVKT
jgi:outer membrane protein OmpA-like peptidoglycan-associated protein